MSRTTRRRLTDIALFAGLVAAWVTHESGALLHSLVSLGFTAALIAHLNNNWPVYRALLRRRTPTAGIDSLIGSAMAATVVTGLVFWATSGDTTLWHEPIAIAATVPLLAHFWVHRGAVGRLLRPRPRTPRDVQTL